MLIICSSGFLTKFSIFSPEIFAQYIGFPSFVEGKDISGLYSVLLAYNSR